ncbi:MAG: hypothetical protein JXX28_19085 [Deltaproteobacteria bacterium]|nr:hypothetical protein [Deltaproteobacteria bacterium]
MNPFALLAAALLAYVRPDPAPGLLMSKERSRQLECAVVTTQAAVERRPGQLAPEGSRGDMADRGAVLCSERLLRAGLRAPRDEAILSTLELRVSELAATAVSVRPDLSDRTWRVEPFHPSAQVSAKIAFATKNALMAHGAAVSDRLVTLAAGDVDVITRMAPDLAYPAACARYAANGSLGEGDALLAVVLRDPLETALHAGVCADGRWSWLR